MAISRHLYLSPTSIQPQGEEIGMTDTIISWEQSVDPQARNENKDQFYLFSRDIARTPFQWDDSTSAGFSEGNSTWLPVNVNYYSRNVEIQRRNAKSHLNVYKRLVSLRRSPAFVNGTYEGTVLEEDVFAYRR